MNENPISTVPLAGEVCSQFIRCGKTGCRCSQGELHGPYYYRIWREGATVHKVYVKSRDMESVKAACKAHKTLSGTLQELKKARLKLTQGIQKEWRRTQRLAKS